MKKNISAIRRNYERPGLSIKEVESDPISQFGKWLQEVIDSNNPEPTAMTLATTDGSHVSARMVLLKEVTREGFTFYTNYLSKKSKQLEKHNHAALVFYWPEFDRQVRVEGTVEKTTQEEADKYFNSRPYESRVSAIASPQSQALRDRKQLEERLAKVKVENSIEKIERPDYWGGYKLKPTIIEFWQGKPNRLHDRIQYRWEEESWKLCRLAP